MRGALVNKIRSKEIMNKGYLLPAYYLPDQDKVLIVILITDMYQLKLSI